MGNSWGDQSVSNVTPWSLEYFVVGMVLPEILISSTVLTSFGPWGKQRGFSQDRFRYAVSVDKIAPMSVPVSIPVQSSAYETSDRSAGGAGMWLM